MTLLVQHLHSGEAQLNGCPLVLHKRLDRRNVGVCLLRPDDVVLSLESLPSPGRSHSLAIQTRHRQRGVVCALLMTYHNPDFTPLFFFLPDQAPSILPFSLPLSAASLDLRRSDRVLTASGFNRLDYSSIVLHITPSNCCL